MTDDELHFLHIGRIVRWMLEELAVPYVTTLLDFATTMRSPEYLAINPMGKVPAIVHGKIVVTETAAICAYLADAFPGAGLAPPSDSLLRGPYYRWLFFAAGPIDAAVSNHALGITVPDELASKMGYGTYELAIDVLESAVSKGPYLLGETFSAADVYVGSHIGIGMQFNLIEQRPVFERYWSILSSRPAAIRAREIDDGLANGEKRKDEQPWNTSQTI